MSIKKKRYPVGELVVLSKQAEKLSNRWKLKGGYGIVLSNKKRLGYPYLCLWFKDGERTEEVFKRYELKKMKVEKK